MLPLPAAGMLPPGVAQTSEKASATEPPVKPPISGWMKVPVAVCDPSPAA
jgi:hypothetical protein